MRGKVGRIMIHKQTNKTAIQSQNMIAAALYRLMEHTGFHQITITQICEEAGVGRKTFYRNFDFKEDVIDFSLEALCSQYGGEIEHTPEEERLRRHFLFVRQHAQQFILLYRHGLHQRVTDCFSALLPKAMPCWSADPVRQEYYSRYVTAGVEAIMRVWVERGFQESVEDITEMAQRASIPIR